VYWLRLHVRYSLSLGWRDAIRKTSEHVVIGVIVVLTGAGLAWLTTHQFGDALLLLLAWPAAFALFYLYFVVNRLAGRDPQWEHWYNTPAVDGGRQVNVRIAWWDPRCRQGESSRSGCGTPRARRRSLQAGRSAAEVGFTARPKARREPSSRSSASEGRRLRGGGT
jgi:hypothetical protein